jgi:ligand-binding sensor domain-containing protein
LSIALGIHQKRRTPEDNVIDRIVMKCDQLTRFMEIMLLGAVFNVQALYSWNNYINRHNATCMVADSSGVWLGTNDAGLVYFNDSTGEETVFEKDNGFITDQVIDIERGQNHSIWIASSQALACFSQKAWLTYSFLEGTIGDITVDVDGAVWVASGSKIFKLVSDRFEAMTDFSAVRKPDEYVTDIVAGFADSSLYLRANRRIFKYSIQGKLLAIIEIPLMNPMDLIADHQGRLFIAGVDSVGVFLNNAWKIYSPSLNNLSSGVLKLKRSEAGDIWAYGLSDVMVYKNGIWDVRQKYLAGEKRITALAPLSSTAAWVSGAFFFALLDSSGTKEIKTNSPGTNNIIFVYPDNQGVLWVQSQFDKGLVRRVNGIWTYSYLFNPLAGKAKRMLVTRQGVHWFLLPQNVYIYRNKINNVIVEQVTGSGFVPPGQLNDFCEDHSGRIWFATSLGVVPDNGPGYDSKNTGFPSNVIRCIIARSDSSIWIGGTNGTLAFFKDNQWTLQSFIQSFTVNCMAEDHSKNLWIGTDKGVIMKTPSEDRYFTASDGIGHNMVNAVCVDFTNRIWVGTDNGLSLRENDTWTNFKRPCGIADNYISSINQSIDSVIWIGTERGISALSANGVSIKNTPNVDLRNTSRFYVKTKTTLLTHSARFQGNDWYLVNGKKTVLPENGQAFPHMQIVISRKKTIDSQKETEK